jgi:hypothetical protein
MARAEASFTRYHWDRFCGVIATLLLLLQKRSFTVIRAMPMASLFIISAGSVFRARCQTTSAYVSASIIGEADLPDAPSPAPAPQQTPQSNVPFLSQRFNRPLQPMDFGEKFRYLVEPAFGPRSLVTNAIGAGIRMANPPSRYPHEWRAGAEAYGRDYGDSFARSGAESLGRFSIAVLLHEDPRYRRSASTFLPTRLGHAFVFTFADTTDGGHGTVAISNFTGAAASGFIGNAYLPAGFDNLAHAGQRSVIAFGGMAAQNVMQEFSPELSQFLKMIHLPHIPTPPVWWTGDK